MNDVVLMAVVYCFHNLTKFLSGFVFTHVPILNQVLYSKCIHMGHLKVENAKHLHTLTYTCTLCNIIIMEIR